jgi:hypothetical protein
MLEDGVNSERRNDMDGIICELTMNVREESVREAGEEDSAMMPKLTLLTLLYAHAGFSFECERSIELKGSSGAGIRLGID